MVKICIIDSGYYKLHPQLNGIRVAETICFSRCDGNITQSFDADDKIGHGTAITSIVFSCCPAAEFYILKIFDETWECDEELLVYALHYVYNHIDCDYINISSGITMSEKREEIEQLCCKIKEKNTIIVSAFDNNGAVSYPAALDNVIGVDSDIQCKTRNDFVYVKNSIVNVFGYGNIQRVAWTEPLYMIVSGSSFACAYITGLLAAANIKGFYDANQYLENKAKRIIEFPVPLQNTPSFTIKKAIVFPCNKETKGLVDHHTTLPFELINIFDIPKLGNVGKKLFSLDERNYMTVKNVKDINWEEDFDTVILGHMCDVDRLIGPEQRKSIVENCIKHHKNIFSFDKIEKEYVLDCECSVYYPEATYMDSSFGKLYDICVPVLGVFGTSSKQGKFTLQLMLRKMFIDSGYSIGQIGTEPSSFLYGMDETFHFGFNSCFNLSSVTFITYLNHTLNRLQNNGAEIIIGGCQSNTIPYSINNTRYLNHRQSEFLIGLNPDATILCINPFDDIAYIERNVKYIEALTESKVIAFVLFPLDISDFWTPNYRKRIKQTDSDNIKLSLQHKFGIPCYVLGVDGEMIALFNDILDFFGDEKVE